MAQIFHPSSNTIAKASIFGAVFVIGGALWLVMEMVRSPYKTEANVPLEQPVQFSHEHHVSGLGIDCRYCHTTVESSNFAGIPSTKVCMTCHSQVWTNAEILEPVRASWRNNEPLRWTRVHDLPDFVQFNHSIHVAKGVGCYSCHGEVDRMPLMWKEHSLHMQWCLDCHRDPAKHLRSRDEIFVMRERTVPKGADGKQKDPHEYGRELMQLYGVTTDIPREPGHEKFPNPLTNCSVCHY
jgi:Class III cytochrome C family